MENRSICRWSTLWSSTTIFVCQRVICLNFWWLCHSQRYQLRWWALTQKPAATRWKTWRRHIYIGIHILHMCIWIDNSNSPSWIARPSKIHRHERQAAAAMDSHHLLHHGQAQTYALLVSWAGKTIGLPFFWWEQYGKIWKNHGIGMLTMMFVQLSLNDFARIQKRSLLRSTPRCILVAMIRHWHAIEITYELSSREVQLMHKHECTVSIIYIYNIFTHIFVIPQMRYIGNLWAANF